MQNTLNKKKVVRNKRALRVRKKLRGTSEKPRMSVLKTNAHLHVQLIDDENGVTLASISTLSKEFRNTEFNKKNRKTANQLGSRIAEIAKEKKIETVIFDRGRFKYHGILSELADAARSGGLRF